MTIPRKRGRPKLDRPAKVSQRPKAITQGKEAQRVTVRLSDGMATYLEGYALLRGLSSISAAIREIIMTSPVPSREVTQQSPQNHACDKE